MLDHLFRRLLAGLAIFGTASAACGAQATRPSDVVPPEFRRPMDPAKVPEPLRDLVPLVEKFSATGSGAVYAIADQVEADPKLMEELLAGVATFTVEKQRVLNEWGKTTELTLSNEYSRFYFFGGLLDTLDVDLPSEKRDPIESALDDLKEFRGSPARAGRMHAAQDLADRFESAREALPALREAAANDPAPEVRAWAHVAIGFITDDVATAKREVEALRPLAKAGSIEAMDVDSALEELDRPLAERRQRRLVSACILNDIDALKHLLPHVDVNRVDEEGGQPLGYAIGNDHVEATEFLLTSGATPNFIDDRDKQSPLHKAVVRPRKSAQLVALLLKHGADPLVRDGDGLTPRDLAIKGGRTEAAELLRQAEKAK